MKSAAGFIVIAMLGITTNAKATNSLPIPAGYYVRGDTPCQQASNATIILYDGVSFGGAHVECRKPSVKKLTDGSYQFTRQCRDMQGNGGWWQRRVENYVVVGQAELIVTNSFGKFRYRYCPQSNLPDSWNKVDLKSISVK